MPCYTRFNIKTRHQGVVQMKKTGKTLVTLATALTIATGFSSTASAATYTVQTGDSLWAISQKYNTTVSNLKTINNLSSNIIYPSQVLQTSSSDTTASSTYTVRAGDSLWAISKTHGMSVTNLKTWNNLTSDMIYVGQVLKLNAGSTDTTIQMASVNYDALVVAEAKKLVGTPYKWGGTTPAGFDCSGFIYYVFNKAGIDISRTSAAGYYNQATKISSPQIGDLVFFSNTYKPGISHMGIFVGNNSFVHASSSGVQLTSLSNPYWSKYFTGYGSF